MWAFRFLAATEGKPARQNARRLGVSDAPRRPEFDRGDVATADGAANGFGVNLRGVGDGFGGVNDRKALNRLRDVRFHIVTLRQVAPNE